MTAELKLDDVPKVSSRQILDLLRRRHSKDLFIAECKDGPTHSPGPEGMVRMDAWAMPRSWSAPAVWAYEIKVSRADFLQDEKWQRYLPLCNRFYFVAPPGVIRVEELGDGVGLLQCSKNAKMLRTVRKAAIRDVEIPENVWRYVLMCRARIVDETAGDNVSREEMGRRWLAQKESKRELGWEIGRTVRSMVIEAQQEAKRLRAEAREIKLFRDAMEEMRISPTDWRSRDMGGEILKKLRGELPPRLLYDLEKAEAQLSRTRKQLEAFESGGADPDD